MTDVVTVFLRHRGDVLLVRRSDEVGTYRGRWGGVSGYVEGDAGLTRPDAERELDEEVGATDATFVRAGDPLHVVDERNDREWTVHPFLFEAADRAVEANSEITDHEWVAPGAMFDRECVPGLWATYRRVAPTVEDVAGDDTHGSAAVSATALSVLRDAASEAAHADGLDDPSVRDRDDVVAVARRLRDARPAMAVVANRVNRVMAGGGDLRAVAERAHAELRAALDADEAAASEAAAVLRDRIDGTPTVLTISRSGTALAAIREADAAVVVGESRTANEGVAVAEELAAAGHEVTLTTDAALPSVVAGDVGPEPDAVVVGADAVLADGDVGNKVGTRALGLACEREDCPLYVVAAHDKVAVDDAFRGEEGDHAALYDGTAAVDVANPVFDRTPADCVDAVVTERGALDADAVAAVAEEHRENARWDE